MKLTRLQLFDFRNFHRLDLPLDSGPAVFVGDNAQGKTNLLEAIYLLATMRSPRAETDAQLVRQEALGDVLPAARAVGEIETAAGPLKVEVALGLRPGPQGPIASKVARVNGVPKRLADAVGRLIAVLFTAEDLDLVVGSPSLRRRFLDITLSQLDSRYAAARARYERALLQRNHLLRRIREREASPDELPFWDDSLARDAGRIFHARAEAIGALARQAREAHAALAPSEELSITYLPRLEAGPPDLAADGPEAATEAYTAALKRGLSRDVAAGMTLQGPHRDDLTFSLNGHPAAGFVSRAQQRTIALSLRLAEARFLLDRRRESPVLLLDDVLSEMDAARRRSVLSSLAQYDQVLVTGSDLDRFPPQLLDRAALFAVAGGSVSPLVEQGTGARTADA